MTPLKQLQHDMQRFLLTNQSSARSYITGINDNFITERLAIYSDAYVLRLQEILATDFPGLKALTGDELFESLTQTYLSVYPSTYANARYLGENLAKFLATDKDYQTKLELMEMAQFEWALGMAEDAADANLLTPNDLAEIPEEAWPELTFRLHPSVQFLTLDFNIPALWQAAVSRKKLPKLKSVKSQIWTVWRYNLTAHYHNHNEIELLFLQAVASNKNFAEICEILSDVVSTDETAQQAITLILTFLNNQMFIKEEMPTPYGPF